MTFGRLITLALALFAPALWAQSLIVDNLDPAHFTSRLSGGDNEGVVILMYHGLDAAHGQDPAGFEAQMQWLDDSGFTTITLDHLQSWITTGSPPLPLKPIVLTFDDNYITIHTVAFPSLQSHGFVGINFTHTAYVGTVTSYDHADWNEINEMESAGVIFTESHTVSHLYLTTLGDSALTSELADSRAAIGANIPGKTCRHLAYPYGDYDARVISFAQAIGYETAVTTQSGLNTRSTPLMELHREAVYPNTPLASFQETVNQTAGSGEWTHSTSEPNHWGDDYQYVAPGSGEAVARWTFSPTETGLHRVQAWYTSHANRATNAPFTVTHRDGEATVPIDQTVGGGTWVDIGDFYFNADDYYTVSLSNDADGYVIADAIRVEWVAEVPAGLVMLGSE